jgi:Cof subfamily protein (haloacid dehalogenase superfamily)
LVTVARPKFIAADIDGTLLTPSHEVSALTRVAFSRLVSAGASVVLATSRYPEAVRAIQLALGSSTEPIVACQGAVIARRAGDEWDVGRETLINPEAAAALSELGRELGLNVSWYSARTWLAEFGDPMAAQEADITKCRPTLVDRLDPDRGLPAKVVLMATAGRMDRIPEALRRLPPDVTGSVSRPDYVEVVAAGVSKWSALCELYASSGVDPAATAAIGDGLNDFDMVNHAGIGIAMGHAPFSLRQAAAWTVPSNAEEGFAVAVDRLFATGWVG